MYTHFIINRLNYFKFYKQERLVDIRQAFLIKLYHKI